MITRTISRGVLAAALSLGTVATATFMPHAAFAQVPAQIAGTVTDPTGAVVPSAAVSVRNIDTGDLRSITANGAGLFTVQNLLPGTYEISVSAPGFSTYKKTVVIAIGADFTVNAPLTTGSSNQTVEVSANETTEVNTTNAEISQVMTPEQVSQLPSLTRNPYDFVAIAGNVSAGDNSSNGAAQNGANRGVSFSLNGQRNSGTEILLDGVENTYIFGDSVAVHVPLDDVYEYRVITNNFPAEYGRASGGVVSVATKSGTNSFHGSLWEFNRLSATTANTVANAQADIAKGVYTRNMFGAAVGGRIIKDKLFFFASTELLRVRSTANQLVSVPSAQYIAAAAPNVQSYFTTYAGAVTGNVVSTTLNSDLGTGGAPLYPGLTAATPIFNNISYSSPNDAGGGLPQNTYNVTGRVDYNLGQKTQMFFRYVDYNEQDQIGSVVSTPYAQYNVGGATVSQAYLLSVAHEFNSAVSTIGKLSFTRVNLSNTYNQALENVPTLNYAPDATNPATGTAIILPGFYNQNPADGGLPYGGPQNTSQYNQDLTYTVKKHQFQFGGQVLYIQENQGYGAYAQASEQIGKSYAQAAGVAADPTTNPATPQTTGNFLTGTLYKFSVAVNPQGATPCTSAQVSASLQPGGTVPGTCAIQLPAQAPSFERSYRFHDWAVYGQDQFKVTPKFTATYGLRYEYYGVQHNNNQNLDSNFYYGPGSGVLAQVRSGTVLTVPNSPIHSFWNPQYGTVSPRLGFAYDVFGNGKSSFRGGYGISYERNFGNVTFNAIQNPPNYAVLALTTGVNGNYAVTNNNFGPLAGAAGTVALPPTSLRHIDQNIRTAQTQFWSAAIDQQVGHNNLLEVSYNGSRGIHLYDIKNYNIPGEGNLYLGDGPAATYSQLTYPNPHFTNDNNRGSNGDSYYEAANVKFVSQDFRHTGLSLTANYTFAHATDDLSTTFSETAQESAFTLGYTNAFNPALDHGNSDFDIRHRLVIAPVYQTPWFQKGSFVKQLIGGYEFTGIYTLRSGTPFTLYDSTNDYSGYQVPRYNPSAPVTQHHFTKIPSGQTGGGVDNYTLGNLPVNTPFGNAAVAGISDLGPYPSTMIGRNTFTGPGAYNLDVSASKIIPIHERINFEFRAEGFDVTNHHNLYIVETLDDAANYAGVPFAITGRKGGAGYSPASDERRFLQFAGKINF